MGNLCASAAPTTDTDMATMKNKLDAILNDEPIHFSTGSEDLVQDDLHILKKVATVLKEYPNLGLKIESAGFGAPEVGKMADHEIERLSLLRSRSVGAQLERDGVPPTFAIACVGLKREELHGRIACSLTPMPREEALKLDEAIRKDEVVTAEESMDTATMLDIIFEIPGDAAGDSQDKGEEIEVHFHVKPLGFDFNTESPIKVKNVTPGSHADEVGVKPGWIMRSLNGKALPTKAGEFKKAYAQLAEAVKGLPGPPPAPGK